MFSPVRAKSKRTRNAMPKCLNIEEWRAATKSEIVAFLNVSKQEPKSQRHLLVVRTHLRPIDVYAYLKARFGAPNGFQNFLRKDDSDNWIHWDFNLKADDADLYFAGTSRDIHIVVGEPLTDEQWKALIISLKHDFRRLGRDKSDVLRGFEKFCDLSEQVREFGRTMCRPSRRYR